MITYAKLIQKIATLTKISRKLFKTEEISDSDKKLKILKRFLTEGLGYIFNGVNSNSHEEYKPASGQGQDVVLPIDHQGNDVSAAYKQLFDPGNSNNRPLSDESGRLLSTFQARHLFYLFLSMYYDKKFASKLADLTNYPKIHKKFFKEKQIINIIFEKLKQIDTDNRKLNIYYQNKPIGNTSLSEETIYFFEIKNLNQNTIASVELELKDIAIYGDEDDALDINNNIYTVVVNILFEFIVNVKNQNLKKELEIHISNQQSMDSINSKIDIFFYNIKKILTDLTYENPINIDEIQQQINAPTNQSNIEQDKNSLPKDPWADKRQKKK